MRIGTNISAINSCRNLGKNNNAIQKDVEKLASGFKINRARDDASGLAITEKMRAQITALDVASRNCEDGISLVQTADGYLEEVHNMMQRMHELGMKSANGILDDDTDRTALQDEFSELQEEIDRIGETANFNGNKLFIENKVAVTPVKPVTQMGAFKIIGNASNVSYANGVLTVLGSEDITIEGTGSATTDMIKIADGITANVTIKNINIQLNSDGDALNIGHGSTLNLTLVGTNTLKSYASNIIWNYPGHAGLHIDGASNLVITENSTGSLRAVGSGYGAGIGKTNMSRANGGNITINGGTITAVASADAAGIGACWNCSFGNITINGGTITSNGEGSSAGIGSAYNTNCGRIDITGGTITAKGGSGAQAIGPSKNGASGTITKNNCIINGTTYGNPAPPPSGGNNQGTGGGNPVIPTNNNTSKRAFVLQIGETSGDADKLNVDIGPMNTEILGIRAVNINTQSDAGNAVEAVKTAIDRLSFQRANLGAYQNRLEHTINNLETTKVNIEASKSRIKDTDMAKQMMKYTQNNVLIQSAQAMLAQANTQPQQVLSLLQ